MRAWVQIDQLTGLNLTTGDVINAIQSQNVQAAVGRIGARPISNDQQLQLNLQTKGRLTSVDEFANIVIRTNPDGSVLRLRDVARLELGAANLDRETHFNGGPAAAIAIYQSPGANAIKTLQAVRDRLSELQKRFPDDLAWRVTYDPTAFVTATIEEVVKTLIEAFVLVVIVVYLFLGSVRANLGSDFRDTGQSDRHIYRAERDRIFRQHGFASCCGSRHRHRRRRRDRCGRKRRARDGGTPRAFAR